MAIVTQHGIDLEPYQVVLRPLVTEKGTHLSARHNVYAFEVHSLATKEDIRKAVESLFNVRVRKVRTQTRVGKPRRGKTSVSTTKPWKRALVTLADDDRISLF